MRKFFLVALISMFSNVNAQSFDPIVITAMDEAEMAINEELSMTEQAQCDQIFKKVVSPKSKSFKSCRNYRANLKSYKESILHARTEIQLLTDWAPTSKLFVLPPNNHVFLHLPSKVVIKHNPVLVSKLDKLYTAIYQYPLIYPSPIIK